MNKNASLNNTYQSFFDPTCGINIILISHSVNGLRAFSPKKKKKYHVCRFQLRYNRIGACIASHVCYLIESFCSNNDTFPSSFPSYPFAFLWKSCSEWNSNCTYKTAACLLRLQARYFTFISCKHTLVKHRERCFQYQLNNVKVLWWQ